MATHVALLRGVNVGGRNRLPMAELRAALAGAGYTDVLSYIQTGNVVFGSPEPVTAGAFEELVATEFGLDITVVLRTVQELERVVAENPFRGLDTKKCHVGFLTAEPDQNRVESLDKERFAPERFAIVGREEYLYLPDGMARTKLPDYLHRQLRVDATLRNWNTVNALIELASR